MHAVKHHLFIFLVCAASIADTLQLEQRTPFDIPLAKLSVGFDESAATFDKIKVTLDDEPSFYLITFYDDQFVKISKNGRTKQSFREHLDKAYLISDFEAVLFDKICKSWTQTLSLFEDNVKRERWDRCLYLDAYLPRFLSSFRYLYSVTRNTTSLQGTPDIADSSFDVSLNSPKSDFRIQKWRSTADYPVKLRIATKELIFQIKEWQKKDLSKKNRNPELSGYTKNFEDAFSLFVKIYFNSKPTPPLPDRNKKL